MRFPLWIIHKDLCWEIDINACLPVVPPAYLVLLLIKEALEGLGLEHSAAVFNQEIGMPVKLTTERCSRDVLCGEKRDSLTEMAVFTTKQYVEEEAPLASREEIVVELKCHDEPGTCLLESVRRASRFFIFLQVFVLAAISCLPDCRRTRGYRDKQMVKVMLYPDMFSPDNGQDVYEEEAYSSDVENRTPSDDQHDLSPPGDFRGLLSPHTQVAMEDNLAVGPFTLVLPCCVFCGPLT